MLTPATRLDAEAMRRCIDSPAVFAEVVLGLELFGWQREVAEDRSRYRCLLGGRQIGKSTLLGALALHRAWAPLPGERRGGKVLVASTIDDAGKRLLDAAVRLAKAAPLLKDSVEDDRMHRLVLSNGGEVLAIPSSLRQALGHTADALVTDESGYLDDQFFEHLEPVVAARPNAWIVAAGTPWGDVTAWFRSTWQRYWDSPDPGGWGRSWRLPAEVSPLVDRGWLEEKRKSMDPAKYARMYGAEWTDVSGAFFAERELMDSVVDYELAEPGDWRRWGKGRQFPACGGVDWAYSRDANVLCLLSVLDDEERHGRDVFYLSWLERHAGLEYMEFVKRIVAVGESVDLHVTATELNGVGAAPSQELERACMRTGRAQYVRGVWTDARRKQSGFGKLKTMMQAGQLILPLHAGLLADLRGLVFEEMPSGTVKIGAGAGKPSPDMGMALMQAGSCCSTWRQWDASAWAPGWVHPGQQPTPRGVWFPQIPWPRPGYYGGFFSPEGGERSADSAW